MVFKKLCDNLHRAMSIRVQFCSENLVGKVILGKKLCAIIELIYSFIMGLFPSFSKYIL